MSVDLEYAYITSCQQQNFYYGSEFEILSQEESLISKAVQMHSWEHLDDTIKINSDVTDVLKVTNITEEILGFQ
jgi:hypothetical protein